MKIRIDKFYIDLNEDKMRKSRKDSYVKECVKALQYTGIDKDMLTDKISEAYDAVVKK